MKLYHVNLEWKQRLRKLLTKRWPTREVLCRCIDERRLECQIQQLKWYFDRYVALVQIVSNEGKTQVRGGCDDRSVASVIDVPEI